MNNNIYEVTRNDYKSFVEQIIPECREIENINAGIYHFTYIRSKKSKKRLCGRRTFIGKNINEKHPEKYYIYEFPEDEERRPPIPKLNITLETKEEVQAFFDAIFANNRENKND